MNTAMHARALLSCVPPLAALLLALPARAQEDTSPPPPVSLSASATALTDYRFRGVSRSGGDPAVQGQVEADALLGLYGGAFASSTGARAGPLRGGTGDAEVDLFAGYQRPVGAFRLDGGLRYYAFPGHADGRPSDYAEPYLSLGYALGPASAKLGAAYAWGGQGALGGRDSLYLRADAALGVPRTPFTLKAHLGRSDGALGRVGPAGSGDVYWDWSATAEASRGHVRLGVSYVDTDVTTAAGFAGRRDRGATALAYAGLVF